MKERKYKFALGERVFILGHNGICVVTGRGKMNFLSGGCREVYSIVGAHSVITTEDILISESAAAKLNFSWLRK